MTGGNFDGFGKAHFSKVHIRLIIGLLLEFPCFLFSESPSP